MSRPTEGKLFPFVHARRVKWGESDPARIAYTARFLDFSMDAIEAFLLDRLGAGFYELNVDRGVGTPFVHVELDFRSPLTPRDELETEVRLVRLGGGSLGFAVRGRVGERLAFEGRMVCAIAEIGGTAIRATRVPDWIRAGLRADAEFAGAEEHDIGATSPAAV
ncbi:thioesterase family protein [Pararoseomonas sp. SCSIO 73927]|uniref:acyl-CoA thioesterase n=1 Tax=Pararoseomonas sp. SCSIO 73927 TaxID=3114537 RepID=UPI0030D0E3F7